MKKDKANIKIGDKSEFSNSWYVIKRLIKYLDKSIFFLIIVLIIAVSGTVMKVFTPKLLGNATTLIFNEVSKDGRVNFNKLGIILLVIGIMYGWIFIASFLQERIMVKISQKATCRMRNELKEKLNRLPIAFFDKNPNGDLMSIAINDIENITSNLQQSLIQLLTTVITIIGSAYFMLSINISLGITVLIIIPISVLIIKFLTPRIQKFNKGYYKNIGQLNNQIEDIYHNFELIKVFNGEEKLIKNFNEVNLNIYETGWKSKVIGGLITPIMMLIQNSIYILIVIIGSIKVLGGVISIGDVQAFLQYSQQVTSPITKISSTWNNILLAITSAERVFNILDIEEIDYSEVNFENNKEYEDKKIVFDHVKFGYDEKLILKDFSRDIEKGQMTAIVGQTGSGKSTLINLIERFYEIKGGAIFIDGIDIRNIPFNKLRKSISIVFQDTWLFSGTILENIRYGNKNATDEEVFKAAKATYVHEFVEKLPDGYNTVLTEEAENISIGQRQLITIARAFIANPEILILDEATSNIDSRTEELIQKAMKELLKNRTSFVVAHRLSTIYEADSIIVMNEGECVEFGNHEELIKKNGVYSEIYNSQFSMN